MGFPAFEHFERVLQIQLPSVYLIHMPDLLRAEDISKRGEIILHPFSDLDVLNPECPKTMNSEVHQSKLTSNRVIVLQSFAKSLESLHFSN